MSAALERSERKLSALSYEARSREEHRKPDDSSYQYAFGMLFVSPNQLSEKAYHGFGKVEGQTTTLMKGME